MKFRVFQWKYICNGASGSHSVMSYSLQPHGPHSPWNSPGQNNGVGSLSLLQGIFPTQGSNPDLPHGRWILYQLSHKGNSGILEWVAYPFSSGSSRPKNPTGIFCIAGRFFTNWAIREALTVLADTAKHKVSSVSLIFFSSFPGKLHKEIKKETHAQMAAALADLFSLQTHWTSTFQI